MSKAESQLRNFGIVAHINAGKTTLTERILFATGRQRVMGEVDDGTATMDFLAEEQRRGISIAAAGTAVAWRGHRLNLLDTPGHVDFTAEVQRSLRVVDGVVVVLDGVRGVESQTETVWRQADARRAPRLVFVNKLDRVGADVGRAVESLRERLGVRAVPVVWPLIGEGGLCGLLDVITGRIATPRGSSPQLDPALAAGLRQQLIEVCADVDESILADFVEERAVDADRLHRALRRLVLAGEVVPVLVGAALPCVGVDLLLDAVCRYLPSPLDLPPVESLDPADGGAPERRPPSREAPFCGLVFRGGGPRTDEPALVRVYSGTLSAGDRIASTCGAEAEIDSLLELHADHPEPLARALPGDVVAVAAPMELRTGDTVFAPGAPMRLEPLAFPRPVVSVALEPRAPGDEAVVEAAAKRLAADDPTLVLEREPDAGRLLVSGMGELHLEVFKSRLQRRVGDAVRVGRPRVARLETVRGPAAASAECRAGGEGSARAFVGIEVAPAWGGARVESAVQDRVEAIALLEEVRERLRTGLSAGYPATDLTVRLVAVEGDAGGEQGAVLYLEALSVALRKAVAAAGVVLMEPEMAFAVECPADGLSAVIGDLRSLGAQIEGVESSGGPAEVRGSVLLRPMLGYATRLRNLSRGLGTISLRPKGFAPV